MTFLSVPSNLLGLTAAVGLLLMVLCLRRVGPIAAGLSLAAIALAALSPLGNVLLTPLENRFPEEVYPAPGLDGIIVLGGSYDRVRNSYVSTIVLEDDTQPLALMVDLARRYPEARIIFSGTDAPIPDGNEASFVKHYFVSLGIAPERILTEERSRTTAESARFTANLLQPSPSSRWLLVTFGYRMPRAVGAFRRAGFDVVAFPAGLRTKGWDQMWTPEISATDNLRHLDIAVHEWLGLLYYKVKGYADEWFAAPRDEQSVRPPRQTDKMVVAKCIIGGSNALSTCPSSFKMLGGPSENGGQ